MSPCMHLKTKLLTVINVLRGMFTKFSMNRKHSLIFTKQNLG